MIQVYRAFGLMIASELACPELLPGEGLSRVSMRCSQVLNGERQMAGNTTIASFPAKSAAGQHGAVRPPTQGIPR